MNAQEVRYSTRKAAALGALAGLLVLMIPGSVVGYFALPEFLNRYFPVLGNVEVVSAEQVGRKVSFYLRITKVAAGNPRYYVFFVRGNLQSGIPVLAYKGDGGCDKEVNRSAFVVHAVGATWVDHYCFTLPSTVDENQGYTVGGEAAHDAWGPLRVKQLPSFVPVRREGAIVSPCPELPA